MTESGGRFERIEAWGPTPWAASITVWGAPGILVFFMPLVFDYQFGDGEPAGWIKAGSIWWLTGLALVATLAISVGYWLPRVIHARRRDTWYPDLHGESGLLLTAWGTMTFTTIWVSLAFGMDPAWLPWLVGAAAAYGLLAQAHQIAWLLRRVRRAEGAELAKRRAELAKRRKRS